jgi:hypothetical protein
MQQGKFKGKLRLKLGFYGNLFLNGLYAVILNHVQMAAGTILQPHFFAHYITGAAYTYWHYWLYAD